MLFTTLAPSGILACALLALAVAFGHLDEKGRARLAHATVIPLLVSMVGLVASATHLGTPANALYVLTGVGRSPLSNEVACTVAFLTPGGLHWLYSFSLHVHRRLQQAWCAAVAASGVAAVASIGFAYSAPTIVAWSHWSVPPALGFSAVGGAPLIAGFTARAARVDVRAALTWLLFGCGLAGLLGALTCLGLEGGWLREAANALGPLAERIPCYPALTAAYGAAGLLAYAAAGTAIVRGRRRNARAPGLSTQSQGLYGLYGERSNGPILDSCLKRASLLRDSELKRGAHEVRP